MSNVDLLLELLEDDLQTLDSGLKEKTELVTEILLLKLYIKKLPKSMQDDLIEVVRLDMAQEKRLSELSLVQLSSEISLA